MKVRNIILVSILAAFAAASCAKTSPEAGLPSKAAEGEGESVTLTFSTGVQTRSSFDNGSSATVLEVFAFNSDGTYYPLLKPSVTPVREGNTFSCSLTVVKGLSYKFVFVAHSGEGALVFHPEESAPYMQLDYEHLNVNSAKDDAFWGSATWQSGNPTSISVELKRPFAQVNVLSSADDQARALAAGLTAAELAALSTGLTVANLPDRLNLLDGSVSGAYSGTFPLATRPSETYLDGFQWLCSCFVLAPASPQSWQLTFCCSTGRGTILRNLPASQFAANHNTDFKGYILSPDGTITLL